MAAIAFLRPGLPLHAQADIRLSSELSRNAAGGDSNVSQRNPMIIGRKGNAIALTYERASNPYPNILAAWDPGSNDTASIVQTATESMKVQDGGVFIVSTFEQIAGWVQTPGHSMTPFFSYTSEIILPTPEHWAQTFNYESYKEGQYGTGTAAPSFDHKHALVLFNVGNSWRIVGSFDQNGNNEWLASSGDLPIGSYDHLIPLSDRRFAVIYSGIIAVFDTNRLLLQKNLPDVDQRDQYWPLPGSRFLRTRPADGGFSMVLYDSTATPLDSLFLPSVGNISSVSVCENNFGGKIVVAAATNLGIRGFSIGDSLNKLFTSNESGFLDVLLSSTSDSVTHPSVFLSNDSLFVIWEDYRNGASDIYGRIHRLSTIGTEQPGLDLVNVSAHPNPAIDQISIDIALNREEADVTVDLVDAAGHRLLHNQLGALGSGVHEYGLDVSGIAAGSYFVAVTGSLGKGSVPVIVLRR